MPNHHFLSDRSRGETVLEEAPSDRFDGAQSIFMPNLKWFENTRPKPSLSGTTDLVSFSHLRWDFVYQRPQHLLSRCAQSRRVFLVEEPMPSADDSCHLEISRRDCGVWVAVPHLPQDVIEECRTLEGELLCIALQQQLLNALFSEAQIQFPILWYYTPMAVPFTHHLKASAVVYDCMDELSAFKS
jgi:UDP-galactopyranose mutase